MQPKDHNGDDLYTSMQSLVLERMAWKYFQLVFMIIYVSCCFIPFCMRISRNKSIQLNSIKFGRHNILKSMKRKKTFKYILRQLDGEYWWHCVICYRGGKYTTTSNIDRK